MAHITTKEGETIGHYHDEATEDIAVLTALFKSKLENLVSDKGLDKAKESLSMTFGNKRMTQATLFTFARLEVEKCIQLAERKNKDYAGHSDPFKNLRRGGPFGIAVRLDAST